MEIESYDLEPIIELLGYTPTILLQFDRAFPSWGCDGKGWIVEHKGQKQIILTNHGSPYIATEEELHNDIHRYEALIAGTKEALSFVHLFGAYGVGC